MSPLVSIVIPTYNGADYLKLAIDSVLEQTYTNIELIVLDDGSTDSTIEILQSYEEGLFIWQSHSNMGQASTLNKGWRMSKGDIISYLSADDLLLPNAVELAVQCLGNNSVILSYCDYMLVDSESRTIKKVEAPEYSYYDTAIKLINQPGPGVFFKRHVFENAGGWNGEYRQMPDFEYWLRIGLLGEFIRIPVVCAHYRVHELSQTFSSHSVAKANEPIAIISRYFESPHDIPAGIREKRKTSYSNAYLMSCRLHIRSYRYKDGLRQLYKAWRMDPLNLIHLRSIRILANALLSKPLYMLLWRMKSLKRR